MRGFFFIQQYQQSKDARLQKLQLTFLLKDKLVFRGKYLYKQLKLFKNRL